LIEAATSTLADINTMSDDEQPLGEQADTQQQPQEQQQQEQQEQEQKQQQPQQQQQQVEEKEPQQPTTETVPTDDNDNELKTPTKIHMIPKEDSFKTCKTEIPSAMRRKLRMTPARNSILSGGTPFKEVSSSGKKFNSRRKVARAAQTSKLDETGGSNETFVRHEQDLLFDRDSLETHPPSVRRHRISSTPKPLERVELLSSVKPFPRPIPAPPKPVESKFKAPLMRPPKPKPQQQNIQQKPFNRFVTPRHNVTNRCPESARSSIFKRSMNTTNALNRSQSFKSTAELERDYFNSLRSRV
jgi:hypothetical protein